MRKWIKNNRDLLISTALLPFLIQAFLMLLNNMSTQVEIYQAESIFLGMLLSNYLFLIVGVILLCYFKRKLSWEDVTETKYLRIFILLICFVLARKASLYEFNYFLNQRHLVDRILIILLLAGVWYKPICVLPFIFSVGIILGQFNIPFAQYSRTDKYIYLVVTMCFISLIIFHKGKRCIEKNFYILTVASIAAVYFIPGIAKLELGNTLGSRIRNNQTGNLLVWSYTYGWLSWMEKEYILTISKLINSYSGWVNLLVVLAEVSGIYLLVQGKKYAKIFIVLAILLHFSIFILSGVFFRDWIILLIAWFFLIAKHAKPLHFGDQLFFLLFVVLSPIIIFPPSLAWWDSGVAIIYRAVGINGKNIDKEIGFLDLAPHDLVFTQNRFYKINDSCVHSIGTYGNVSGPTSSHIYTRPISYLALLRQNSQKREVNSDSLQEKIFRAVDCLDSKEDSRNDEYKETMNYFLETYRKHLIKKSKIHDIISYFSAPHHIYTNKSTYTGLFESIGFKESVYMYTGESIVLKQEKYIIK